MIIDLDIERLDFTTNVHFINRIGGVIISVLVSSAVDRGFESWSGQTKDYKIGGYVVLYLLVHASDVKEASSMAMSPL
jgi:hypothetical protein